VPNHPLTNFIFCVVDKASVFKTFIFGGISGMTATAVVQPADMVKVRI